MRCSMPWPGRKIIFIAKLYTTSRIAIMWHKQLEHCYFAIDSKADFRLKYKYTDRLIDKFVLAGYKWCRNDWKYMYQYSPLHPWSQTGDWLSSLHDCLTAKSLQKEKYMYINGNGQQHDGPTLWQLTVK